MFDDYSTLRPSIELDHISRNFFGHQNKRGGPFRRLGMEAILEREEARFGCRLPLRVPCYIECPQCIGTGETWGWALCPRCQGLGAVETVGQLLIEIPRGTRDGDRYEVDLTSSGINNLLLEVRIVVR